jgi:hypothetical protein
MTMNRRLSVYNRYEGETFRSLLESSWAKAFDAAGIAWSYEPTRLVVGNRTYLPDFYLDGIGYLEMKPVVPTLPQFFLAARFAEFDGGPFYFFVGYPDCRNGEPTFFTAKRILAARGVRVAFVSCSSPVRWQ